ncbi:MAG: peptide MFS transporter [Rhodothalassiaceae bacterium]
MTDKIVDVPVETEPHVEIDMKQWFGHPRQLFLLFTTEMWERFGYYGMRAILILYLTKHFIFDQGVASGLYGAFTSLVYLTPLVGGLLADKYLGSKRSIKFGAILMALGYFGLTFGGEAAKPYLEYDGQRYDVVKQADGNGEDAQYVVAGGKHFRIVGEPDGSVTLEGSDGTVLPANLARGSFDFDGERSPFFIHLMLISLATIVVGNGFFKPNISTIVGALYKEGDGRRDAGFTIFYMGINLGSLLSQIFVPLFAVWFGWAEAFGLVVVGMVLSWALIQFENGRLRGLGERPAEAKGGVSDLVIYAGALVTIPVMWFLMTGAMEAASAMAEAQSTGVLGYFLAQPLLGKMMIIVFLAAIIGIPVYSLLTMEPGEGHRMVVATVLIFFSTVFWTLFEQAGSSMTLFAEHNTDRSIGFGIAMEAGQVQLFNPLFIVLLAPVFSMMWSRLASRGREPSTPVKFSLGLMQVGLGFIVLAFGANFADDSFRVGIVWLALAYLLHSTGELCLSPVGLSMITKLSVARLVGLMMGAWFMSSAMAQYAGGIVAQFASSETVGGQVLNREAALSNSLDVFNTIGIWAFGIGIFLLLISPLLRKGMHGVH